MARTTSAGPREESAHAVAAIARMLRSAKSIARRSVDARRLTPLTTVTLLHLATLAIALPRLDEAHAFLALVVAASLSLTIVTLTLPAAAGHVEDKAGDDSEPELDDQPAASMIEPIVPPPPMPDTRPIMLPARAAVTALSPSARRDLMARVSHELRTPLNAVVGFSDLMGHELFGPLGHPRYEEYVRHIRDSGHKLLKSTEDTLAITSLLTGDDRARCEEVALASIARDARQIIVTGDARRIAIDYDIAADISVMSHRRALRQILVNLLAEGVSRADDTGRVVVAARCAGDKVSVSVTTSSARALPHDGHASLPVCLARTLLELTGGELQESERDGYWRATTLLDRAAQCDFFFAPRADAVMARAV